MTIPMIYVEAVLSRDLTDSEATYLDTVVAMAEAQVESALPGFSFATGTATDEIIHNGDPDIMWTSRYPVTAVTSIKRDAAALSATSFAWTEKGRLALGTSVVLNEFEIAPWTFTTRGVYTVTYGYGFVPEDIPVDLCTEVARLVSTSLQRQSANPDGIEAESLGAYSVTYGRNPSMGFPPVSYELTRRWSRNRQVSVPLVRLR